MFDNFKEYKNNIPPKTKNKAPSKPPKSKPPKKKEKNKNEFLDSISVFFTDKYFSKNYLLFQKFFFISSITLLISMFFCSVFFAAKVGYYINTVHLDQYNSLLVLGIIIGVLSLILFGINCVYTIFIFLKLYLFKKKTKNLRFYVYSIILGIDALITILLIVLLAINYKLIFIIEIILIFYSLLFAFLYFDEKYELDFKFIKKINNKIISSLDHEKIKNNLFGNNIFNKQDQNNVDESKTETKNKDKKEKD